MNWTPEQKVNRRHGMAGFSAAFGCLLLFYSGVLANALLA
jgi:hypothetical protein